MSLISDILGLLKFKKEKEKLNLEVEKLQREVKSIKSPIEIANFEQIKVYDAKVKVLLEKIKDLEKRLLKLIHWLKFGDSYAQLS